MSLSDALQQGRREALSQLADTLAAEIPTIVNARDRLATVRTFLATLAALEQLDAQTLRRTQAEARSGVSVDSGGSLSAIDELKARRARRRA